MFDREAAVSFHKRSKADRRTGVGVTSKAVTSVGRDQPQFPSESAVDRAGIRVDRPPGGVAERDAEDRRWSRPYKELAVVTDAQRADTGLGGAPIGRPTIGDIQSAEPSRASGERGRSRRPIGSNRRPRSLVMSTRSKPSDADVVDRCQVPHDYSGPRF